MPSKKKSKSTENSPPKTRRPWDIWLIMLAFVALTAALVMRPAPASPEWDEETLDLFRSLPVQDGGRVKPMDTYAQFMLLKMNGKRSLWVEDEASGQKRKVYPVEWLMNVYFHPDRARHFKNFIIETWDVAEAVGIPYEGKKKRDRYTFDEIEPRRQQLLSLASQYTHKEPADRTPLEQQIVHLANNYLEFEAAVHFFDWARHEYPVHATEGMKLLYKEGENRLSAVLAKADTLRGAFTALDHGGENLDPEKTRQEKDAILQLIRDMEIHARQGVELKQRELVPGILPPAADHGDSKEWLVPGQLIEHAFSHGSMDTQLGWMAALEDMARNTGDPAQFKTALARYHAGVVQAAEAEGTYAKVPIEVFFYKGKYFFWSQFFYIFCFLLVAFQWFKPHLNPNPVYTGAGIVSALKNGLLRLGRAIHRATPYTLLVPTALLAAGITLRCVIRNRPPVTTLYETVLFITAVAVIVALLMEWMTRQRIALSVGAILGVLGMFLANKYEIKEGVDTMPSLVAVLDTNFWLATHVTTVTMGYGAGLLAAAIAHVYLIGKALGFHRNNKSAFKTMAKMTYGVICFGLVFSVVGTVLGGIWANDSWGRFWGWDPKENGALMIVLWELVILHARMGGYIRDHGLCMAAVFGAIIVAFSWWGVNLLGVGLHSYGFTSGVLRILITFYIIESAVMFIGAYAWFADRLRERMGAESAPVTPEIAK